MTAIGMDILNIGGSKWNQQFSELESSNPIGFAPTQFMLPSVDNVRTFVLSPSMHNLITIYFSLRNFAEQILTQKKERTMIKILNL